MKTRSVPWETLNDQTIISSEADVFSVEILLTTASGKRYKISAARAYSSSASVWSALVLYEIEDE